MQKEVEAFLDQYGLRVKPEIRYLDFVGEVGELGRKILCSNDYGSRPFSVTSEVEEKAGECLFSLVALFAECGIDAEATLQDILAAYRKRMSELGESNADAVCPQVNQ